MGKNKNIIGVKNIRRTRWQFASLRQETLIFEQRRSKNQSFLTKIVELPTRPLRLRWGTCSFAPLADNLPHQNKCTPMRLDAASKHVTAYYLIHDRI